MTDKQIERALECCGNHNTNCKGCPLSDIGGEPYCGCVTKLQIAALPYINRLKFEKQLAETQLKELLSALYQRADNKDKSFTIYQKDIVELAKDYGIREEKLR